MLIFSKEHLRISAPRQTRKHVLVGSPDAQGHQRASPGSELEWMRCVIVKDSYVGLIENRVNRKMFERGCNELARLRVNEGAHMKV